MSIDNALQRVSTISQALLNPSSLVGSTAAVTGGTAAPGAITTSDAPAQTGATFAAALQSAVASATPAGVSALLPGTTGATGAVGAAGATGAAGADAGAGAGAGAGNQIVAAAASQIGQAEQPPGSNDSPAIAQYRTATAGAAAGEPWCAYFASWAARQAGEPLGDQGQGLGSVSAIWSWAQSSGRAVQNGPGVTPKPGDLIVFGGEHVGVVAGVLPDGRIQTIEGNYQDKVSQNVRGAGEATGYVSMS